MNAGQIYAKTPIGDEAVRQSTRVVQRNLRMVLVQVDGKLTVAELSEKIGNARLVENAIRELESGGYIVPLEAATAAWAKPSEPVKREQVSAISQFSTFGPSKASANGEIHSRASQFSTFGKPVLPAPQLVEPREDLLPPVAEKPASFKFSLSKLFFALLGVAFFAILLVLVYPYDRHRDELSVAAGDVLKLPVSIGHVSLQFLPRPRLQLSTLEIGDSRIANVWIDQPWRLITGGAQAIEKVTAGGGELSLAQVMASPLLARTDLPALRQLAVENLTVRASSGLAFAPLSGHLDFASGVFTGGALEDAGRSLLVALKPGQGGLDLGIEGRAWRLPELRGEFSAMQAKGKLSPDRLLVTNIDTSFLGGLLQGEWEISWGNGSLSMKGSGQLKRIDLAQVSSSLLPMTGFAGELSGPLQITGQGDSWSALWQASETQLKIKAQRGVLNGLDIGEAGRRGAGASVRAGMTRFDTLEADLKVDPDNILLRDIHLEAGAMSASGQVAATREGEIDGRLVMAAKSSVATVRVPLTLSGKLPELTVSADR